MHRASQLFLPTLRQDPAEADAASHRLLLRAGFVRAVGAGLYSFLPLGWRTHQRVVQIIREEMDAIGGQEMLCPILTPAELWERSGRIGLNELYHVNDSSGRPFVLALSHEETFALHAREIQSYRELPKILYHFGTKARDAPRVRGGLLRMREFIMKDAYSFDRNEEGLDESYEKHSTAYSRMFERCGLEFYVAEADPGDMGGSASQDFLAPTESGENELILCERGDYAADVDTASSVPSRPEFDGRFAGPEPVETPAARTIEQVSEFLGVDPRTTVKAMPVVADGKVVLGLLRGDHRLHEIKFGRALGEFRPAHPDEIRETFGADPGSIGPVGAAVEIVADEAIREGSYVAGANRDGWHLQGVEPGRDFQPRFSDIREVESGDTCVRCGGALRRQAAIEIGHIFKLGTYYSGPLDVNYLDEAGRERPIVMGCYGIGPARTMAAIVEQHHDELGISWPTSAAPLDVHVVVLPGLEEQGERVAAVFEEAGRSVLLDDRDARAGEKFADADLIGLPWRVTVGKKTLDDDAVDVRRRDSGEDRRVSIAEVGSVL